MLSDQQITDIIIALIGQKQVFLGGTSKGTGREIAELYLSIKENSSKKLEDVLDDDDDD